MIATRQDEDREIVGEGLSRRMVLCGIGGLTIGAASMAGETAWAAPAAETNNARPMAQTAVASLTGSWTYRSFVNDPDPAMAFNALRFAVAELVIEPFVPGDFTGRLIFSPDAQMALVGASSFGNPFTMRFQGHGISAGIEDFVYDYIGYLVPVWPNGVDQRPALVGSVVRTEPHAGGEEVGVVASFIAIRRDDS